MTSLQIAGLVFASLFGSALLGVLLRKILPPHHLAADAKDTVKVAMGLVATMTALVLGLLVASAKSSYDTQRSEVIQMAAKIAFLNRLLTVYGPEAAGARDQLHRAVDAYVAHLWPDTPPGTSLGIPPDVVNGQATYAALQQLSPSNDLQRAAKAQALQNATDIGQMRWLLYEQSGSSISKPLLLVVIAWLAFIFLSFGLFAPPNATVITALMVAALSVAGSIFLILELDRPFSGLIEISSDPLRHAMETAERRP